MKRPRPPSQAFTLMELIFSISILLIVIVLVSGALNHVARLAQGGTGSMKTQGDARQVLDFIASELALVTPPLPGQPGNRPRLRLLGNPANTQLPYRYPHLLAWESAADPVQSGNALETLAYFIRRTPSDGSAFASALCRMAVPVALPADQGIPLVYRDTDWLTPDYLDAEAPANEDNDYRGLFAERVLALWIRALDAYGEPITKDAKGTGVGYEFDSEAGYTDSKNRVHPPPCLPPALEVALVIADESATMRMGSSLPQPVASNPALFHQEIKNYIGGFPASQQASIRHFVRRIPLFCQP